MKPFLDGFAAIYSVEKYIKKLAKMAWGAPRGIDDIITRVRANDPSLTSLYLMRQRRFELADAKALCDALIKNTMLRDLNVSSHAVSPEIAAAFASLLATTNVLKILDLGNASFGDQVSNGILVYTSDCINTQKTVYSSKKSPISFFFNFRVSRHSALVLLLPGLSFA